MTPDLQAANLHRNELGLTLPFALILTFVFSALVSVAFLFVSVNLNQMYSNYKSVQAISLAEGINERIKARLNTKIRVDISPKQEELLKLGEEDLFDDEEDDDEDLFAFDEDFDEDIEDFDEYYADEVLKISRYITFRDTTEFSEEAEENESYASPDTQEQQEEGEALEDSSSADDPASNVKSIGTIDIPAGTTLTKGTKVVVFKDERVNLDLDDITQESTPIKQKLPAPIIKSLSPNYSEANTRTGFTVYGENLSYDQSVRFNQQDIFIEDIKSGPYVECLIEDAMPGLVRFYWDTTRAEFYIIPTYDGSPRPVIDYIRRSDGEEFFSAKAGQRKIALEISGLNFSPNKNLPIVIPDAVGIIPQVQNQSENGYSISITLNIERKVEPGVHSLSIATEGGISNSWVFNVLPPDEEEDISGNTAVVSSSLTLLDIKVIEDILPLIDEGEEETTSQQDADDDDDFFDVAESQKLSDFANVDLETMWLLESSAMIGKTTKTVSEIISRQIPNIHAAVSTNGELRFNGGSFRISGTSIASTKLLEPTYISGNVLVVGKEEEGEEIEEVEPAQAGRAPDATELQEEAPTLLESGFSPGGFVAVHKEGGRIENLDYGVISQVNENVIELQPPGLKDFHYEGDSVTQFIPPVISREKIDETEGEKHLIPKELAITLPGFANSRNVFRTNLDQFAELAELYTNDSTIPEDESSIPVGYMGLSYLETTPVYNSGNPLTGKGILIIDTRSDNLGRPAGEVTLGGDSRSPIEFSGILYVHGNLRIDGNVTINGALIVDNEQTGTVEIASNALGRIAYDERAIKQALLHLPFTTKPGSIMVSNKPLDLEGYVQSGKGDAQEQDITPGAQQTTEQIAVESPPEESIIEEPEVPTFEHFGGEVERPREKSPEEELIDLF